ncbi:ribose-5-phosphate isomerase [Paenibacillus cellulosilyticus]|uniref:Ribose-5-phosphate isomerase A n=1 Tax=Paenibacillus cellulosilyticus TaxID=375489 RepID=A0A2V2YVL3_9BACL|nr:ribose-5-phosphate isomerase RpiA [Paenibacillus cellulosilyticus]PWV94482.1 ribose-5-phosphate isomerase [Paenibacillus cellulosilyticus]QKS44995.1 ribose-5-phosphate isomerase RpiA [Paenibacillus cellulosilyticus]
MNAKKAAADKAVELIQDGMTVGLGTGSTAYWAIHRIAERMKEEGLQLQAVSSSKNSEQLANQLGIPIIPFSAVETIDITIDGADEVDGESSLIKGGGGALLREKIIASNSKEFVVIVDESKLVETLGKFPLPIEIVPFAAELTIRRLEQLGCRPVVRMADESTFITDNGNWIVDCHFDEIKRPGELGERIKTIPGVVEHGLFVQMASTIVVGHLDGTTTVR